MSMQNKGLARPTKKLSQLPLLLPQSIKRKECQRLKVQKHSKTGKRTGFIEIALEKNSQKFIELIEASIRFSVEATIESFYKSILNR
jgi:hypothetical protein